VSAAADTVVREVTSWEGVTSRRAAGAGGVELRLGPHVLGTVPAGVAVDERTLLARLRDAYVRAAAALDRRAGVPA
jgi:hypothetical protein